MAATGKLAGATIINNFGLANALAQAGVKYVVHRTVRGSGDAQPQLTGTPADEQTGKDFWNSGACQGDQQGLDSGVYVIPYGSNEQNYPLDAWFFLGLMTAATAQGRKLAVFSNSVGNPQDLTFDAAGVAHCPTWKLRADVCMKFGADHGHLACLHQYGRSIGATGTTDPGSAIWHDGHRDDTAYRWYGGRHFAIWRDVIPADRRMKIFIGECGASAANLHGPSLLSDFAGYQTRYGTDENIAAFCYWTVGGSMGYGFDYSTIDSDLPALLDMLKGA